MSIITTVAQLELCSVSKTSRSPSVMVIVAELILPRFGEPLAPLPCVVDRVRAGHRFLKSAKDLVQCVASDLTLAAGGEDDVAVRVLPDDVFFDEPGEERFQVDVRIDVAALLERAHPAHGFLDIAAGLQQQMIEQTPQPHLGEELPDQIGIKVGVPVSHC